MNAIRRNLLPICRSRAPGAGVWGEKTWLGAGAGNAEIEMRMGETKDRLGEGDGIYTAGSRGLDGDGIAEGF